MEKEYNNLARRLDIKELVYQIVFMLINRNDYTEAAKMMVDNNISVSNLCSHTTKLTSNHYAKLTDSILLIKQ